MYFTFTDDCIRCYFFPHQWNAAAWLWEGLSKLLVQTSECVKRTLALSFHRITSELAIRKLSSVFYLTLTKTFFCENLSLPAWNNIFSFYSETHRFGFIHLLRCRFSLFARFLPLFAQIFSSSGLFDGRWHGSLEPHHGKFKWIWSDCVFDGDKCGKFCTSVLHFRSCFLLFFFTRGLNSSFISF